MFGLFKPRTYYTVVRNGVIRHTGKKSEHHCGFGRGKYPYRVEIMVSGKLQPPEYFVVANETIDDYVQQVFKRKYQTESCEKMSDDICMAMLKLMEDYPQWRTEVVRVELTGTAGRANLSCEWRRRSVR